jgi:hypothetical protein
VVENGHQHLAVPVPVLQHLRSPARSAGLFRLPPWRSAQVPGMRPDLRPPATSAAGPDTEPPGPAGRVSPRASWSTRSPAAPRPPVRTAPGNGWASPRHGPRSDGRPRGERPQRVTEHEIDG